MNRRVLDYPDVALDVILKCNAMPLRSLRKLITIVTTLNPEKTGWFMGRVTE
jgi:hypothetical protein